MAIDFSKYAKRAGDEFKKLGPLLEKISMGAKPAPAPNAGEVQANDGVDTSSSLTKVLVGTPASVEEYYFPPELIGGTCPRIVGEEEEIVWNAAAEACDTERVHVVWHAVENKIWYIAIRSSELASHPNTWCPFAAILPGMKNSQALPVCYTYYSDDSAAMVLLTQDGLQIYRGTNLVVRAKAERSAREIGNAAIIELIPDRILQMTPVPWYSLSLFEDRARRILAALAVFTALTLASMSFVVWLIASMSLIASRHDLTDTLARTQTKTMELMRTVEKLRSSPMREQLGAFADLNDNLINLNGLLEVYEVKDGKTRWRAVIPSNITADRINDIGGKNIESNDQTVTIGNSVEAENAAAAAGRK